MKREIILLLTAVFCAFSFAVHADDCTNVSASWPISSAEDFARLTTEGTVWSFGSYGTKYYALASGGYNQEGWLLTPEFDLRGAQSITLSFSHAHKFAGTPSEELTLWMTSFYTGDVATSSWEQLTIPNYSNQSSWTFINNTVSVPVDKAGEQTVFAFCYRSTEMNHAQWEVNNISLTSVCKSGSGGDKPAGRLRVCGQNMLNYFIHYDNYSSKRANYDGVAFAAKTHKIVNAFLQIDADIYAMCEVEACALVLEQLADSLNKFAGKKIYAAVPDGIEEAWNSQYDNNMKSGFIYRTDKVTPIRQNTAASWFNYYKNTMRIQAFEEILSGEKLVVSMNHFRAKTSDDSDEMRVTNASHLISSLKKSLGDPDILILGDLNCEIGEEPITMLENAGYKEQLVLYDATTYSHCYGGGELIDHVLANETMAKQIVDARVQHICTQCKGYSNSATSYSDHDPYTVDIALGDYLGTGDEMCDCSQRVAQKRLLNGQLYIIIDEQTYDMMGNRVQK